MPLSEHEERMLAEIERQLEEDDPRLLDRAQRPRGWSVGHRLPWAAAGFVVGLLCLLGLTFHLAWGVAGFVLILTSVLVAARELRDRGSDAARRLRQRLDQAFDDDASSGST